MSSKSQKKIGETSDNSIETEKRHFFNLPMIPFFRKYRDIHRELASAVDWTEIRDPESILPFHSSPQEYSDFERSVGYRLNYYADSFQLLIEDIRPYIDMVQMFIDFTKDYVQSSYFCKDCYDEEVWITKDEFTNKTQHLGFLTIEYCYLRSYDLINSFQQKYNEYSIDLSFSKEYLLGELADKHFIETGEMDGNRIFETQRNVDFETIDYIKIHRSHFDNKLWV